MQSELNLINELPFEIMISFTVIISLHKSDRADWFYQAASSVLEQTCPPTYMLVTIDGDLLPDQESKLLELKENYKTIVISEVRSKAVNSRGVLLGKAVKKCETQLVAIMDADDMALKDRFEKQLRAFAENPELDVLGGWVEEISPYDDQHSMIRTVPAKQVEILSFAKYRNPINNMTVMFKRDSVLAAGNFEGMQNFADYWLWVRMLNSGAVFGNISEVLVRARAAEDMIGRRSGVKYAISEIRFYLHGTKIGFLSTTNAIIAILTRVPLRLLPQQTLFAVFKKFLRQ